MVQEITTQLIADPRKSAGKNALCVVIDHWPLRHMNRFGWRHSFYLKGFIDDYKFTMYRIYPADNQQFHLRLNSEMKKAIGNKKVGDTVRLRIDKDRMMHRESGEFYDALFAEDRYTSSFYLSLEKEQKALFTEWMATASTKDERLDRTVKCIEAFRQRQTFHKMKRAHAAQRKL